MHMKLKCLITACLLAVSPYALSAQTLYIGQYNIRNVNAKDSAAANFTLGICIKQL